MEVIYEKHPVSPERKAELRAQGLKIIDARFDPDRSADVEPVPVTRESIQGMKKADLVGLLEAHGAETGGNVPELKDRLTQVMFV